MRIVLLLLIVITASSMAPKAKTEDGVPLLNRDDQQFISVLHDSLMATVKLREGRKFNVKISPSAKESEWTVNFQFTQRAFGDELLGRVLQDGTVTVTRGF